MSIRIVYSFSFEMFREQIEQVGADFIPCDGYDFDMEDKENADRVGKDNEVAVSSVVLPQVDTTSVVQSALRPVLWMDATELTFPKLAPGKKAKGVVLLRNDGKSTLEITSLQVFHPALSVGLGKMKIAPGQTEKLKLTVQQKYLSLSRSRLRVLMTTNDPSHSKVLFDVKQGN